MRIILFTVILILFSCGPKKNAVPETVDFNAEESKIRFGQPDPYEAWMMNEYDVWEYLRGFPAESEILATFGQPDSIFEDFDQTIKIYYYFIPKMNDYNSIEIDENSGKVTGFEWD